MSRTSFFLPERLYQYLLSSSIRETADQQALRAHAAAMPEGMMQSSPEQVQLLGLLARAIGAKRYLEIGVFTGYSTLAVALALPDDGHVVACDISEPFTAIARTYWSRAGVAEKIDLRIGDARQTLDDLLGDGNENTFDLAYIDADKTGYDAYFERALQLVRPNALIAFDNVFQDGAVADPGNPSPSVAAIQDLNAKLARDDRVDISMIPIGDGLTLLRKR